MKRVTPEKIDELGENEIFVFGSSLGGLHQGGASKLAMKKFGAVLEMVYKGSLMQFLL